MTNKGAVAVPQIPRISVDELSCGRESTVDDQPSDVIDNDCIPAESMSTISKLLIYFNLVFGSFQRCLSRHNK